MANVINATQTGNGGLVSTGDDSGILNIQTNETTAVSVDASQNLTFTNAINAPNTFGFKNRIINGGMVVNQYARGTFNVSTVGATPTDYTADRFLVYKDQSGATIAASNSSTAPTGFTNSTLWSVTTGANAAAGEQCFIAQQIEGYNWADLNWGTANAKTVTFSFWVRSSVTGTYGISFSNSSASQVYIATYTISSANTWEQKTITIAGSTSGTWLTTNGIGLRIRMDLGSGANYQTSTPNTWQGTYASTVSGRANLTGTTGATFYVTGVQMEIGTQATSFDFRSYGTELALCQRYLPAFNYNGGGDRFRGAAASTTVSNCVLPFQVQPRVPPTGISVSSASHWSIYSSVNGISGAATAITFGVAGAYTGEVNVTTTAGSPTLAQGNTDVLYPANSSAQILFTGCEL